MENRELEANYREVCVALFEIVDAVCGLDRPWDLTGYGIDHKRAEEICELAERGKAFL